MELIEGGIYRENFTLHRGFRVNRNSIETGYFSTENQFLSGVKIEDKGDGTQLVEVGPRPFTYGLRTTDLNYLEHGFYDENGLTRGLLYTGKSIALGEFSTTALKTGVFINERGKIYSGEFDQTTYQLKEGHQMWQETPEGMEPEGLDLEGIRIYEKGTFKDKKLEGFGIRVTGNYVEQGNFLEGNLTTGVTVALYSMSYETIFNGRRFYFRIDKNSRTLYVSDHSTPLHTRYEMNFDDMENPMIHRIVNGNEVTKYRLVKIDN